MGFGEAAGYDVLFHRFPGKIIKTIVLVIII
jgi:hypothetical protein